MSRPTGRPTGVVLAAAMLCLLCLAGVIPAAAAPAQPQFAGRRIMILVAPRVSSFEPPLSGGGCEPISGQSYDTLIIEGGPSERPAEQHADFNLALRSYRAVDEHRGLVDYNGGTDLNAPQIPTLFSDTRPSRIVGTYQVDDWNWPTNSRGNPIVSPAVTLAGLETSPGEILRVPASRYFISPQGYQVLVLYATTERITLQYTRGDNVVFGYTIHVEGDCVEPGLPDLYNRMNEAGRTSMAALRAGQPFGRANTFEIKVAVRDTGAFLEPRSRKDWYQGR